MHKNILPGSGLWGVVGLIVGTGLDLGTGDKVMINLGNGEANIVRRKCFHISTQSCVIFSMHNSNSFQGNIRILQIMTVCFDNLIWYPLGHDHL